MAQKTVRIISATQAKASPANNHRAVNIATDSLVADTHKQVATELQAAGAAAGNQFPTYVEASHGAAANLTKNGLPIIFISGYSGPS